MADLSSIPPRILDKIAFEPNTGCWLWIGALTSEGYANAHIESRTVKVHRYLYERLVGKIPPGLVPDHLCRVRSCVNPRDLEPVTRAENARRGETGAHHRRKTRCPHGHPYEGDNLVISKSGQRACATCRRGWVRACYRKARAEGRIWPSRAKEV